MENIELISNIASIASPLTKVVLESWLAPKLITIGKKWRLDNQINDHAFKNKFHEYLNERYKSYSIINILAFRNQQRLLKDIYLPLTLCIDSSTKKGTEFVVTNYDKDFILNFQKILIIDTAGMGKSTISKKLFLSSIEQNAGIPVLIELRRLSNKKSIINEIFEELKLLNQEIKIEFVLELIKKGDFIFFLDGYDEISIEHKRLVTEDIQKFANNSANNTFILTSRPDDSLSSFGTFQSFSIKRLKENQVYELLRKYDENGALSQSLILKLKDQYFENLREFLTNPLLVSLLFTAYEYKHTIPLKKHLFYRQVYDALFEAHDLSKGDYYQRDKFSNLNIDEFHTVLRYISFICLKKDRIEFDKDQILSIIDEAKEKCETIKFETSAFLKDLIITVPIFIKEGLYYKWAHKSLYEYFVAQFIYQDSERRPSLLKSVVKTKNHNIIDIYSNIDYKTFRNEIIENEILDFLKFSDQTYKETKAVEAVVNKRKELTYQRDLYLMQFVKSDSTPKRNGRIDFDAFSNKFFKLVSKRFPEAELETNRRTYGVRVSNFINSDISKVNYSVVLDGSTFEEYTLELILRIAFKNGEKFVKKIKKNPKNKLNEFSIKKRVFYQVSDDPNSPLNMVENFDFVNEIISSYYEGDYILDYLECKKFIETNNLRNASAVDDEFYKI
ncbi:MAG TPA: hypothetical protein VL125_12450 [Pelobium sp.]|nr:hypothetical protein [Pelobium sp.]